MTHELEPAERELQARARDLAGTVIAPRAAAVDRDEQYPWDNVAALRDGGGVKGTERGVRDRTRGINVITLPQPPTL